MIWSVWVTAVLVAASAKADAPVPAGLPWAKGVVEAKAAAARDGRPIFLSFHTAWCGWCRRMDAETFRDTRIISRAKRDFVFVSLDAEDGADGSKLAARYRISSFPFQVVIDADGRELARLNGFRAAANLDSELQGVRDSLAKLTALLEREKATPDDVVVAFEVATALERAQRPAEALERYDRVVTSTAEGATRYLDLALWNSAGILLQLERGEDALGRYQRFLAEFADRDRADHALYQIGRLQQVLGRRDDARASFKSLIDRFPRSRFAGTAHGQLRLLDARR